MRFQIDIQNKIIVLLDDVTFGEIDGVLDEIKGMIKDDLMQWKIKTAPTEKAPQSPLPTNPPPFFPGYPHQPFVPVYPQQPLPNTPGTGDPLTIPNQQPITWCSSDTEKIN